VAGPLLFGYLRILLIHVASSSLPELEKTWQKAVGRRLLSDRSAIELMDRNCRKVDALEPPKIDRSHAIALGVRRLRVRMDAASGTKAMFHGVLVEGASACSIVGSPQDQIAPGNKPQQ
jgi:hypothetical protein